MPEVWISCSRLCEAELTHFCAAPDQTHQVCPRHDQGSVRLRSLREESHGAAEGVQGQESAEVHQEEGKFYPDLHAVDHASPPP